jgi:hypothetical protein
MVTSRKFALYDTRGAILCLKPALLIRIMAGGQDRIRMILLSDMEGIMEKRSTVHAVVAEGLVFESNFGGTEGQAIGPSHEVAKHAQSIPAWSAAALACETIKTSDTTA